MYNARRPAGDLCFDPKVSAEQIAVDLGGGSLLLQLVLHRVRRRAGLSLPRFQGQCLESCFYTDPMKTNDHNECPFYASPLQR